MTPLEAYKLFLSIKQHFTQPNYDYFRYNGKVNANLDSFNRRRDKYQFAKLAKHKDPVGYLVAQYVSGDFTGWVGDLFGEAAESTYTDYLSRQQAITYNFKSDISKIEDNFISHFRCRDGQHPQLLVLLRRNKINIETFTILNDLLNFFKVWDTNIDDSIIWPSIRLRSLKYAPFIRYDRAKLKSYIRPLIV